MKLTIINSQNNTKTNYDFISRDNLKRILSDSKIRLDAYFESKISERNEISVTCKPKDIVTTENEPEIHYGFHSTQFGRCLIGITDKGICYLSFTSDKNTEFYLNDLKTRWKKSSVSKNPKSTSEFIDRIFRRNKKKMAKPIDLYLTGTDFQIKVWKALLMIPRGSLVTYSQLANYINYPKAIRAVSNAVAKNPISFIVPCHRVIKKSGDIHKYRWGKEKKISMILSEFYETEYL